MANQEKVEQAVYQLLEALGGPVIITARFLPNC